MHVELVVADAQVLQVDHAAAQGRRVVDADERRVVAEPREVVDLRAVAEDADVRRDRLRVEHLARERLHHEADRMRNGGRAARAREALEVDELDVPADSSVRSGATTARSIVFVVFGPAPTSANASFRPRWWR